MNKLLLLFTGIVILLLTDLTTKGQTVILAEDFSGFNVGSHTTPSTSDVSATLDTKTTVPGWTGALIYPAGGEIKVGTSSATGWIETPSLDLTGNNGNFDISFDLARWPGDAATVQVYLNGLPVGDILTPSDEYQKFTISCTDGTASGKIKIQALTKRFFIDNLSVETDNITTGLNNNAEYRNRIIIYPVPVKDELLMSGTGEFDTGEIFDLTGRNLIQFSISHSEEMKISVTGLRTGIYFIIFRSGDRMKQVRFVKQ